MYISQLTVKNYRNFGDEKFAIKLKKFTTIIGENNIGKSNLLDSIGLILSQDYTMFKKRMLQIDDINFNTRENFKEMVIDSKVKIEDISFPVVEIKITLTDMNNEQLSVVGDWLCDTTLETAKLTYLFRPRPSFDKKDWINKQRELITKVKDESKDKEETITSEDLMKLIEFPIQQYEYLIYGGEDSTNRCDPYFLRMLKLEVLDALRDAKRELIANGEYKLLYRILNHNSDGAFLDIKDLLTQLENKIMINKQIQSIKKTLVDLLDKLSLQEAEGFNKIGFNFSSPETSEILKKLSLIYGSDPITIERNGLGRNNLLYISLILSHLANKCDTSDSCFRIVGIEEPEAHLHPHLQNHLSKNIELINSERDDLQIILTSHSTHITTSLNLDNQVVIYRDNGEIKSHYITAGFENGRENKEHKRYLQKYLDATNSTMFYARKIILVEGISEQILIPVLFQRHVGKTLEQVGCNIVNVNGVAFAHFLEIIKNGYFIKCAVLTDSDKGKHTEKRASDLKVKYDSDKILVEINEDTFEKEILISNLVNDGRKTMLETLKLTRPRAGKDFVESLGEGKIIIEEFFNLIENYKSEFALNLAEQLSIEKNHLIIPDYIKRAFKFLEE